MSTSGKPSSSSSSWSSGTSGRAASARLELPALRARHLLKLLVAFALALGVWFTARAAYSRIVVQGADLVLRAVEGVRGGDVVRVRGNQCEVLVRLRSPEDPPRIVPHRAWLQSQASAILFLVLVGITPLARLARRWRPLCCALLGLVVLQVAGFAATTWVLLEGLRFQAGAPRLSEGGMYALAFAATLWTTTLSFAAPPLLLLPVWLGGRRADRPGNRQLS